MTETGSISHLTELQIYELAAGETLETAAAGHAAACASCGASVEETRRLLATIGSLDTSLAPPSRTELELMRRIRADRGTRRARFRILAGVAAAMVCFAAGAVSHGLWTSAWNRPGSPVPDAPTGALAIQRAGTEYVAAIASLADEADGVSGADLRTGREVAFAAMSGAAYELRRLGDSDLDPETSEIRRLVEDAWRRTAEGDAP
jgi:hypothetical protein